MTSREVILREMGLTPIWVNRATVVDAGLTDMNAPIVAVAQSPEPAPEPEPEQSPAARRVEIENLSWDDLIASITTCTACKLYKSRTNTVPGVGDRSPSWMVIGHGPGENEEKKGEPFVGEEGLLLDAMLVAVGKKRSVGVYITNVIKCRPPGNRTPEPDEIAACTPYLNRQITLARPKLLLATGEFAAQTLLNCDDTEAVMRELSGTNSQRSGVPVVATYHPSYLLESPLKKAKVWDDLMKAKALVP